jgi:hypothetical protein
LSSTLDYDTQCDLLLIGSDEVFNYTQNHSFGYVQEFFGHGVQARQVMSYAACAGFANRQDVIDDDMAEELGSGLRGFLRIGVRDENTREMVEYCTGQLPVMTLDPTLIYDFSSEIPAGPVLRPGYLLVYAYEGRFEDPADIAAVREIARSRGLRIVSACSYQFWCDESVVLKPFELLAAFRDADCVITETFHGTIYSILFQKRFVALLRRQSSLGSNANKVEHLLRQVGLESRIASEATVFERVIEAPIDYAAVVERLAPMQSASRAFLDEALFSAQAESAKSCL